MSLSPVLAERCKESKTVASKGATVEDVIALAPKGMAFSKRFLACQHISGCSSQESEPAESLGSAGTDSETASHVPRRGRISPPTNRKARGMPGASHRSPSGMPWTCIGTPTASCGISLPPRSQVLILSRMQSILEHACFRFARDSMQEILEETGWTCPELGELSVWVHYLKLGSDRLQCLGRERVQGRIHLSGLFYSVSQIRHAAVHRRTMDVEMLQTLIDDAVTFCAILGVPAALEALQTIQATTKEHVQDLSNQLLEVGKKLDEMLLSKQMAQFSLDGGEPFMLED
ncbi:hypothetical protein F66182_6219 [Fusarium sp. NRRL 66182]|nr:hypothetical protein F66182_6219 [Fusarium sp. NRRL 66182]